MERDWINSNAEVNLDLVLDPSLALSEGIQPLIVPIDTERMNPEQKALLLRFCNDHSIALLPTMFIVIGGYSPLDLGSEKDVKSSLPFTS